MPRIPAENNNNNNNKYFYYTRREQRISIYLHGSVFIAWPCAGRDTTVVHVVVVRVRVVCRHLTVKARKPGPLVASMCAD